MRVLQVSHNDAPPFPAVCRAHAHALHSLGADVTTVYLSRTLHGIPNGSDDYLSMHAISGWRGAALLRERFGGQRFDLCIAHRYKACVSLLLARTQVRAGRVIGLAHEFGFFAHRRRRWLRSLVGRKLELAGVSGTLANELTRSDPLHRPTYVLGNVVDLAELDAARLSRQQARTLLGIAADATAVGVVGRLTSKKRPDLALCAFAALHREQRSNTSLHYLGSGEERPVLDKQAHELAVASHVRQHGFVPDAARVLEAFDAILFTSFRDSFGMVLVEAMAAGVPVLATESAVARDVMGPLGHYFEPEAADAAGDSLRRLLDMPDVDRERWRTDARGRVSEHHSVAALADAYAAVLGTDAPRPAAVS